MGKLLNEAFAYRLDENDPKRRIKSTRDYQDFKHMALNTIAHMVFDGMPDRDIK